MTKSGDVLIEHHGRVVTTLRGPIASKFVARAATLDEQGLQHWMARSTGSYKRGNESAASRHARNHGGGFNGSGSGFGGGDGGA